MTDEQRRKQAEGMRAMSNQDMDARAKQKPTRLQRLREWWRECFFSDAADGGM